MIYLSRGDAHPWEIMAWISLTIRHLRKIRLKAGLAYPTVVLGDVY